MDRFSFLSKKQDSPGGLLGQFWKSLTQIAEKSDFKEQLDCWLYDIFISKMQKMALQRRLYTELRGSSNEAGNFATALEKYKKKQALYEAQKKPLQFGVKTESVQL